MTALVPGQLATAPAPGPVAAATPSEVTPPGVLRALARLDELDQRPVAEHVEVFDGVHRLRQDALATLDEV